MSTLELPSKADGVTHREAGVTNLEESLAVIGVKRKESKSIPSSLELPITITNPKIAAKTTQAAIKSVYMTTTAVCGSKMEAATAEYWGGATATAAATGSNGHEGEEVEEDEDQILMVMDEEREEDSVVEDEIITEVVQEVVDEEEVMVVGGGDRAIILSEASEFAT